MWEATVVISSGLLPWLAGCLRTRRHKKGKVAAFSLTIFLFFVYAIYVLLQLLPMAFFFFHFGFCLVTYLIGDKWEWSRNLVDVLFEFLVPVEDYIKRYFKS